MAISTKALLLATVALLAVCVAPVRADTVTDALNLANSAAAGAKAQVADLLQKACLNLRSTLPAKCANSGTLQTFVIPANLNITSFDGCFRSKLGTAADDQQFVCCLNLQSYLRSTLCIPAVTVDADIPALIAKGITDKVDDAVKKALAPISDQVNAALALAKAALDNAKTTVDAVLASIKG